MRTMKHTHDSERGSALLLTLGILSLVLVLAMGFAYSANTSLRIAKVQGATNEARAVVDGAADSLLTDMQYMFAKRDGSGNEEEHYVYPAEDLQARAAGLQQTLLNFSSFTATEPGPSGSASKTIRQNFAVSKDQGRSGANSPSAYEKYYLGRLFSMAEKLPEDIPQGKNGTNFPENTITDTELDTAWYGISDTDFEGNLTYLPQLRPMVGEFKGKLGFAPPLTVSYDLKSGTTTDSQTRVVGRYAYIVLEESNKIDVNHAISLSGRIPTARDLTASSDKLYVGGDWCDRLIVEADYLSPRNGNDFCFNIFDALPGASSTRYAENSTIRMGLVPEELIVNDNYVTQTQQPSASAQETSVGSVQGWLSYDHMWERLAGTYRPSNATSTALNDLFTYTFFSLEDTESYLAGNDGDLPSNRDEITRFDLTGSTWGLDDPTIIPANIVDSALNIDGEETAWCSKRLSKGETDDEYAVRSRKLVRNLVGYENNSSGNLERAPVLFRDANSHQVNYMATLWDGDASKSGKGYIDWLHRMVDSDGTHVGLQVAANLKDYSDSDNIATLETSSGSLAMENNGTTFPDVTFCGNERVAYINEVVMKPSVRRFIQGKNDFFSYDVNLCAGVEMLNIYSQNAQDDVPLGNVVVEAMVNVKAYRQEYEPKTVDGVPVVPEELVKKGTPTVEGTGPDGYLWNADRLITFSKTDAKTDKDGQSLDPIPNNGLGYTSFYYKKNLFAELPDDLKTKIQTDKNLAHYIFVFSVKSIRVVSYVRDTSDIDNVQDISVFNYTGGAPGYTNDAPNRPLEEPGSAVLPLSQVEGLVNFQCTDARCNHLTGNNVWVKSAMAQNQNDLLGTLDQDNVGADRASVFTAATAGSADVDKEVGITFNSSTGTGTGSKVSYSTAFIRNAPMRSLWELGAIHRGYPNQTINLNKYHNAFDTATTVGTASYQNGDAAILDQVKIGPLLFVKGRINSNQRNPEVWRALLNDLDQRWYDGDGTTTVPAAFQPNANANFMANVQLNQLNNSTAWNNVTPSTSRVSSPLAMINAIYTGANDRESEAFIGRTAQLLTSRSDSYSLLLVGESLHDLDMSVTDFNGARGMLVNPVLVTADKGSGYDQVPCDVTGRQKVLLHVVRDAWTNTLKIVDKRYLEDW